MNLEKLFNPKNIAVIGASKDKSSVGYGILSNLASGCVYRCKYCKPFPGKLFPINPHADSIFDLKCYKSILDIRENIDLAVIVVPARIVLDIVNECVKKKVKGVIIISAGFSEKSKWGAKVQKELVDILSKAEIPMVGPNCLGIINAANSMNASFAPAMPPDGKIAFISQSGALADSIIDWSIENMYGFSTIVSYGNKAMLDASDFMRYFDRDKNTKIITLYVEGINDGKKFIRIAKKIKKPIIILKAGRTEQGVKAISSHTGSLAGSYDIYKAAFKQGGVLVADTIEDMFDNAKALANMPKLRGPVAIVTNGGGCGVLCADYCSELGVPLAKLRKSTIKKIDDTKKMHPAYSRRNPLDIVGDALPERYDVAVDAVLSEKYIGGLIVIQTLQSNTRPEEDAEVVIKAKKKYPDKPIICTYMGGKFTKKASNMLEASGIPDYNDVKKAALAMKALMSGIPR
ncbi:MAG: CoA-binding protein [Nanoarchaeota archaeon]|nr:CoA-binding protein [Nanoarchaeota archaeon]